MEDDGSRSLLLLCHQGSFQHLLQGFSAAAAATTTGWRVQMVFYFEALEKLLDDRLDEFPSTAEGRALEDAVETANLRLPSRLLAAARGSGRLRVFACSASLGLLERDAGATAGPVDEVVGWPTVLQLLERADRALYL